MIFRFEKKLYYENRYTNKFNLTAVSLRNEH